MTASNLIDMRTALFFLAVSNLMLAALMASHAHASNSNKMCIRDRY